MRIKSMHQTLNALQSATEQNSAFVTVPVGDVALEGDLYVPQDAKSIVVFAHGSGSSRFSLRNRFVADMLHEHRVGTLLIDLLTKEEEQIDEQTRGLRFNIGLLAERLQKIGAWVLKRPELRGMKLGYFGASTGGAAALIAAALQPDKVAAVVSRGGRPDLASEFLTKVRAPTLLIVGGHDTQVLQLNKQALQSLNGHSRLEIVPQATHLFEEPGALESVARLAAEWFENHSV
jgi:putative phosphoribosyl transferase